ncbi:MAG: hypothetical protein ABR587_03190 [Candidatus Binatia bacterium]
MIGFVLLSCRPAAALDEAGRCFFDKLVADRRGTAVFLHCARAGAKSRARLGVCLARAEERLSRRLDAAERRSARSGFVCPAGAEALGLEGTMSWPLRLLDDAVGGGNATCRQAKAKAMRRLTTGYSRCVEARERHGNSSHDSFDACAMRVRTVFRDDWRSPACTTLDAEQVAERIEWEIDESAARLQVRCGDSLEAGFEQCDDGNTAGGDGCSAECRAERCARVDGEVRCIDCPDDAVASRSYQECACAEGYAGSPGACTDVDECAVIENPCGNRPCVNLPGTWACAIPCTAGALHQALANCGAPSGAIAFDCMDTVIPLPIGAVGKRQVECDDLTIDGAGRNITFELSPICSQVPVEASQCPGGLEEDGTCFCPDLDSGDVFLQLRGDRNVVRDLGVRGFFDGIPVRGHGNLVENVRFDRLCDDAFGSVLGGVGNVFRHLEVHDGCDKCSENDGALGDTDPDPRVENHYNAILEDVDLDDCLQPVRVATSGRFLLRDVRMHGGDDSEFPCDGPRFTASGGEQVVVHIRESSVEGCRRGVRFGGGTGGIISDTRIAGSALRGLRAASTARVSVEGTTIEGNGGSGSTENGFGGAAVVESASIDLGGGQLIIDGTAVRSAGENSLCRNFGPDGKRRDLHNAKTLLVPAVGNWWCTPDSPASRILGSAAYTPWLDRAPLRMRPASR